MSVNLDEVYISRIKWLRPGGIEHFSQWAYIKGEEDGIRRVGEEGFLGVLRFPAKEIRYFLSELSKIPAMKKYGENLERWEKQHSHDDPPSGELPMEERRRIFSEIYHQRDLWAIRQ